MYLAPNASQTRSESGKVIARSAGDLTGLKFTLANAMKDLRYYTHLAEMVNVPSLMGEAVHQSLSTASALGYGKSFVPALVRAQEKLNQIQIAKQ